jgi:histidine triad (HIT) family protein
MYNHAPENYVCPLCAIANDEIEKGPLYSPDDLIYIDQEIYAMISAYQWPKNPGNVVVIPRAHYENIYDLPLRLATRIHDLTRGIALAMKSEWKCDGVSTRQHNEPAGNQDTWHYHIHVTPRFHGDELYKTYKAGKAVMPPRDRARYAKDLVSYMKDWKPANA